MTDDTLLPVALDFTHSRIVKCHMSGQERYAMAQVAKKSRHAESRAALVRHVLLTGLDRLGWDEERMIAEYAKYRLECVRTGVVNEFESE